MRFPVPDTRILRSIVLLLLAMALLPAPGRAAADNPVPLSVFVSILPEVQFVKKVGNGRVRVQALVQPGQSPATYAPTPRQMAALSRAGVYFRIGVPFEKALIPRLLDTMPGLTIVDLRTGLHLMEMENGQAGELDPHTWLDPMLVRQQARTIRDTLIDLDPAGRDTYLAGYTRFAAELDRLNDRLTRVLRPYAGRTIYVFHPAYGYFCRAYNLVQKAVAAGGRKPGARHLAQLIREARTEHARIVFVQPQFSLKTARAFADAIGARVIPLDPLAEDYLANMERMADLIAEALQERP
ncbi:MAG TPA: ABC transporter substrate-binding protein [Desulfobulbus sp.]|nr:ABC transporter substrate-binding protein [Desulfobulbus sp.]